MPSDLNPDNGQAKSETKSETGGQAAGEGERPAAAAPAAVITSEITNERVAVESPPLAPVIEAAPSRQPSDVKREPTLAASDVKSASASRMPMPSFFSSFTGMRDALRGIEIPAVALPKLSRRMRLRATIAAGMAFTAMIGASVAAIPLAYHSSSSAALEKAAAKERATAAKERDQMQQTISRLNKEVAALKASIDSTAKATSAQIGKLSEKLKEEKTDAARRAAAQDTTGSISVPVPTPRPQQVAAKPAIVDGWSIRSAREGLVMVENHGEIFEVVPGAPLPGLGRVEDVRRQPDGRWVVVTPKGLIVAASRPRLPYYERY